MSDLQFSVSNRETFSKGTIKVEVVAEFQSSEEATKFLELVTDAHENVIDGIFWP